MDKDNSKIIISCGITIFLILITWTVMGWPLGLYNIKFWIFIFISLFEAILVVVINEILKNKLKRKKKNNKKNQKINNGLLMTIVILGSLIILSLSGIIWMFDKINQYSNVYPDGTMSYELEDYDKELIIPSYSVIEGEYWDELIIFYSPKNAKQLERELSTILNSSPFTKYETENGDVYYNNDADYTITGYEVHDKLFMNTFNLVYCDGLCN